MYGGGAYIGAVSKWLGSFPGTGFWLSISVILNKMWLVVIALSEYEQKKIFPLWAGLFYE